MNRVTHFEIHVDDMDRAQKFYETVFGWQFKDMGDKFSGYRLIMTGPGPGEIAKGGISVKDWGINGGMMKRNAPRPPEGTSPIGFVNVVGVENLDETIKKLESAGSKCHMPKGEVPGVGWLAYYGDLEGNTFGVIQPMMPM